MTIEKVNKRINERDLEIFKGKNLVLINRKFKI